MPARVLNSRYRLGSLLGRGGMAEVYDGHDEVLDRPVAIKMLRPDMAANPEVRSRFEVEARSAARLHHPNVVAIFDTGDDEGDPYLVMERLPGESLADRVALGPVEPEWMCRVATDVLAALGAAHGAGLIHRDVKPGNVLLAVDGKAKVADFGIAKSMESVGGDDLTHTGLLLGTPAYLAPERIEGAPATPQSDLYAVGVVLYEALAGVKPFVGTTPMAMASAIATLPAPPLDQARPGLDPALVAAVERAMAKDAADRPATAAEMAADLGLAGPPDATVAVADSAPDSATADATLVAGPAALRVPVGAAPASAATMLSGRRRAIVAMVAAGLVLLFVVVALSGGNNGGQAGPDGLGAQLASLADRVEEGNGAKGPEAAEGLREVAAQLKAGGGSDAAGELARKANEWGRSGELSAPALAEIIALLGRVPGIDPTSLTTTTTAAPTTTAPPPPPPARDRGKGRDKDED